MAVKSPSRLAAHQTERVHITDLPITWTNWYQHLNWLNIILIIFIPICGCVAALSTPLQLPTAVFTFVYYGLTALGVTAGYHRLWAHCCYRASTPLKLFLAAFGGGAVQGSIRWWARGHRAHHRYTDTEKDPYSASKGLLFSHIGWMILKENPKKLGRTDISDLNEDWIVRLQHRHYLKIVISMGLLFPAAVCGLGWGDWKGGFIYPGIIRIFLLQQGTFCVNSLAHWLGEQPFDDKHSPRDHMLTAFVTMGEGYHNFHHEFPSDYRNAIQWYQYDPTKWFIWSMKQVGLASDLKTFSENAIEVGRVQQLQKKLDQRRNKLDWGIPLEKLPLMDWDDYVDACEKGRHLIAVAGVIHDVSGFVKDHPGGVAIIKAGVGKDATAMFNGGVYDHSNAAHNLLATMRVGVIRGGLEVEIWRKKSGFKNIN